MRIVVCVRQGLDGELNPFDASAYEAALRIKEAEVIILSMAPPSAGEFLLSLTRLGARRAVLLTDKAFAGADTLATAYTLSLAVKQLSPDLVFCGRQTLVGDTAQTGTMLATLLNYSFITGVMSIDEVKNDSITVTTRASETVTLPHPALITVERIHTLRFPGIFSRPGSLETLDAEALDADVTKCGLSGSPTRVLATRENASGKRKCKWIGFEELEKTVAQARVKQKEQLAAVASEKTLACVISVGEEAKEMASLVSKNVKIIQKTDADTIVRVIRESDPDAVIFASDEWSKRVAATVAAKLSLGLCADCTHLESDGERLFMYRPALSGSIIAKIASNTRPAMATVQTQSDSSDVIVTVGYGAKGTLDKVKALATRLNAELGATRKAVDNELLPYAYQVGLTGKTVAPPVYIAVGVSGAVHHIVGMQSAGTVIAINKDKDAPIFEYADYGILADIEDIL